MENLVQFIKNYKGETMKKYLLIWQFDMPYSDEGCFFLDFDSLNDMKKFIDNLEDETSQKENGFDIEYICSIKKQYVYKDGKFIEEE